MQVVIDGQARADFSSDGTVTEAFSRMVESLAKEGKAVVGLSVDGKAVTPEDLQDKLGAQSAADVNLEITTRPLRELVLESLDELAQSLPELPDACRKLAQVFQSETPEEGYEPFNELASVWEVIKGRQKTVANVLDIDFDEMELHGLKVSDHLRELNGFLVESAQALRDGDTILLGDLLEYELAPRAELEAELVAALRQRAEAAAQ